MGAAKRLRGGCYCGAVGYEVDDAFAYAFNCHCGGCRRVTGAACKPFAGVQRDRLAVTKGHETLLVYGAPQGDNNQHCARCGSLLFSVVREGQYAHVTLGTLIDTPSIRPGAHIFVGSKAAWHTITDPLPLYAAHVTDAGPIDPTPLEAN